MITIVKAIQTCEICPSQWDLWDENGQYYYARYRSGRGTLCRHKSPEWWDIPGDHETHFDPGHNVAEFNLGDKLDGYIELFDFAVNAHFILDLK